MQILVNPLPLLAAPKMMRFANAEIYATDPYEIGSNSNQVAYAAVETTWLRPLRFAA